MYATNNIMYGYATAIVAIQEDNRIFEVAEKGKEIELERNPALIQRKLSGKVERRNGGKIIFSINNFVMHKGSCKGRIITGKRKSVVYLKICVEKVCSLILDLSPISTCKQ